MSCEYCRREAPLTDKVYEDGSKFDDLHGTRIDLLGKVPILESYVTDRYFMLFPWLRIAQDALKILSCRWCVEISYCPMCGAALALPEPLTLGELRGMDGEPVWVSLQNGKPIGYALVSIDIDGPYKDIIFVNGKGFVWNAEKRGLICYRSKPEQCREEHHGTL